MAKQGEPTPTPFQTVAGINESVDLTDKGDTLARAEGVFPFFYGMHQRMFGKKTIDFNPGQQILNAAQTFNGVCLYGYYVETDQKLYYHECQAPPDLRIVFATLQL